MAGRGVTLDAAQEFLDPTLKGQFPDPSSFAGMDAAAAAIVVAVQAAKAIAVFADYDVDGASSAALLIRWLRHMGLEARLYVPDRMTEGYGPSPAAFRRLQVEGADLVVTLDCGAAAHEALETAEALGLDIVVIDHHLMPRPPKGRSIIVNPNRPDCTSGQGVLAAAGVTFVLLAALNREARRQGLFGGELAEPDLRRWLDLAALGAICDVTRLEGFNRALAHQGLRVMSVWANPGLAALMATAKAVLGAASTYHAGFILGPRINAGGRIGRSDLGARLLSTDDPVEALALAEELEILNAGRREVEQAIVEAAIAAVERGANFDPDAPALVVAGDDWHPGVIGIVAGRLRERFRRPVVVVGVDRAADIGRGSGRSTPGVNLGAAVHAAWETGLILSGGGHAMAAGLTLRPSAIPEFRAFLVEALAGESAAAGPEELEIDALVRPDGATRALFDQFQRLAPFGPGNPEPLVALANVQVAKVDALKNGHLRCILVDPTGGSIKAMAWRAEGGKLGTRLLARAGPLHLAGRLRADDWNGRRGVQLEIEDAADPRQRAA